MGGMIWIDSGSVEVFCCVSCVCIFCRQVLRFAAPAEEGDAAKLVPKESEREIRRPMRLKTTSVLADRPASARREEDMKRLQRAVTVAAGMGTKSSLK